MKINLAKLVRVIGRLVVAAPLVADAVRPIVKEVRKPKRIQRPSQPEQLERPEPVDE